eukprot:CAMPEP_0195634764 /NCGR_PEP_ID=MMETSP0815-20121206/22889_1 /TAXON_ID=97485 /ORGANISM="Prymnesium parvum, Strain Texoma1" /LENGTH=62 /DNA_ID=CAMNT_0040776587 /DNA_START=276 /DNA_END=460 /DNA_ORIENTATION=-
MYTEKKATTPPTTAQLARFLGSNMSSGLERRKRRVTVGTPGGRGGGLVAAAADADVLGAAEG